MYNILTDKNELMTNSTQTFTAKYHNHFLKNHENWGKKMHTAIGHNWSYLDFNICF